MITRPTLTTSMTVLLVGLLAAPSARAGLASSPDWTGELNISQNGFGYDVNTAGDVNGDGYSDALVSSPWHGEPGGAFVYHGSPAGLSMTPDWTGQEGTGGIQYGIACAPAGDVNGDGHDDVIVGSWGFENGETGEGAAFVYHGSPTGLSPTYDWMTEGNQEWAIYGEEVAGAGDVNGDGYDDVLVAAKDYTDTHSEEGRVSLFYGSPTGLSPAADWTRDGGVTNMHLGSAIAGAGDVNGDGYDDILVTATAYNGGTGRAWVYFGSATGPNTSIIWLANGQAAGSWFGSAANPAGDVNGDGYADIIIGARNWDAGEGAAYIFHGSAAGPSATHDWFYDLNRPDASFGRDVCTVGDVNGDGYADVIVGADGYTGGQTSEGSVYMFLGGPSGANTSFLWSYQSNETNARLGLSASGAGDVNGDGLSDVIVGAYFMQNGEFDEGLALVFHGKPDGPVWSQPIWTMSGDTSGAQIGNDLSYAGDVNGDGYGDFLVAAQLYPSNAPLSGRVWLMLGQAGGVPTVGAVLDGQTDTEIFGTAVDGGFDVNGDGFSDVMVGTPYYDDTVDDIGGVMVYHGSASGISTTPDLTLVGTQAGAGFGAYLAAAGDVNGDGYDDALVGTILWENGEHWEGRADLFYGSATGLSTTPGWTYESNVAEARLGEVNAIGDVNRDGYADIAIGTLEHPDNPLSYEGGVLVFYGSATGPASTYDWSVSGDENNAEVTTGVSGGDVNGDGFEDLVIASAHVDATAFNSGRIWVYHGSASGLPATANTIIDGQEFEWNFGSDVANAGDVNGDGYSDVVVGAERYRGNNLYQGAVFIHHGSPSGLEMTSEFFSVTEEDEAYLGRAVCSGGDVNGDGLADIVASAPGWDDTGVDMGDIRLFLGGTRYTYGLGGLSVRPRQTNVDDTPLALHGVASQGDRMRIHVDARSPMGRRDARIEWQVAESGTDIASATVLAGSFVDTGSPGGSGSVMPTSVDVTGLIAQTAYQWRTRLRTNSLYAPLSRWMTVAPTVPTMAQFRTGEATVAVGDPAMGPVVPHLAVRPNPMRSSASIAFHTDAAGPVRVVVVDVAGRQVASLLDGFRLAGPQVVDWDGMNHRGRAVSEGVYFVRAETTSGVSIQKIVRLR